MKKFFGKKIRKKKFPPPKISVAAVEKNMFSTLGFKVNGGIFLTAKKKKKPNSILCLFGNKNFFCGKKFSEKNMFSTLGFKVNGGSKKKTTKKEGNFFVCLS